MKHKKLFIALTAVFTVIAALAVFLATWFLADRYEDFKGFRKEFAIPGLKSGAVPQGLGYYGGVYFTSSYYDNGAPSRVYATKHTASESRYLGYFTITVDGEPYTGHCCGVATNGRYVWIASDGTVYVLDYNEVNDAVLQNGTVEVKSKFDAMCGADFCYYYEKSNRGLLLVGEFYRPKNYETDESHHLATPAGESEVNRAVMYQYHALALGQDNDYGLELHTEAKLPKVELAYSIPSKIQGVATTDSGFVLSQSWGLSNSKLYYFKNDDVTKTKEAASKNKLRITYKYNDVRGDEKTHRESVDVYYMYSGNLARTYSIPSMSEGLCASGGKVFVLFESASKKYRAFVREKLDSVYSFIPSEKD